MLRAVALALAGVGKGEHAAPDCEPAVVAAGLRCAYVREHAEACFGEGGLSRWLEVHECYFSPEW